MKKKSAPGIPSPPAVGSQQKWHEMKKNRGGIGGNPGELRFSEVFDSKIPQIQRAAGEIFENGGLGFRKTFDL